MEGVSDPRILSYTAFFYGYSFISRYVVIWYKVYLQDCIFPFISDGDI